MLFEHRRLIAGFNLESFFFFIFPDFVRAVGGGASPLHPPVLPAERCGQRGADQVVGGVPRSGERGQALPHAAPRAARDADDQDSAAALRR